MRAIYGWGYIITNRELNNLVIEDYHKIVRSKYFVRLDPRNHNNNACNFFGIVLNEVKEGRYCVFPPVDNCPHDDFMEMTDMYQKIFPHGEYIKHYLLHTMED